jgi:hypothetical protein
MRGVERDHRGGRVAVQVGPLRCVDIGEVFEGIFLWVWGPRSLTSTLQMPAEWQPIPCRERPRRWPHSISRDGGA